MNTEKLISTLRQVRTIIDGAIEDIEGAGRAIKKSDAHRKEHPVGVTKVSFDVNVLAFMNKYSRRLAGPQKFTLLLARLVKGNASQQVPSAEIEKEWNKMTGVLGGKYNGAYANRAKANGWVDTPKRGVFTLSHSWKETLADNNG